MIFSNKIDSNATFYPNAMNKEDFPLSNRGVRMPRIIYGTAWKKDRTATLVEQAIVLGFRGIDTACQPKHYHEAGVGEGVIAAGRCGIERDELYLQTKFTPLDGQDPGKIPYDRHASLAGQVEQSYQVSLGNLQTDYLDCLILHSPLSDQKQLMIVWRTMEAIQESGGVRQLGISNCYNFSQFRFLYESAKIKPSVIQNRFYADTGYDRDIRMFCHRQGIIYQGFWTLTANPRILQDALIKKTAEKYQRGAAQVFFRFLSQIGVVPLTGTTSAEHMRQDLEIFSFELTANECVNLEGLL